MVRHKNYNLNAIEDYVMFLTSKLMTCFIDSFTSRMKSQSIFNFLFPSESAHKYWISDLEGQVHSIWDLWTGMVWKPDQNFLCQVRLASEVSTRDAWTCSLALLLLWLNNKNVKSPHKYLCMHGWEDNWKYVKVKNCTLSNVWLNLKHRISKLV
jgi:hypothetical protein